jgi:4-hydroxybenzoate polyprenyltransferase
MLKRSLRVANNFLSLVKFSHTIFAMPFALIGFFLAIRLAQSDMEWHLLILVILCMVFARNAAMAFNRFADKEIDLKNPRTAFREIPAGIIKPKSALNFTIINALLFILTTYFINPLTFKLSPLALFIILGYSLTKKFTSLTHLVLGLGLSLAPIGAFIAVTGAFHVIPLIYSVVVLTWVSGFDIIYALQDDEFDRNENLRSIPASTGRKQAIYYSIILHALSGLLVIIPGLLMNLGILYWIGVLIFNGLLIYQHLLVKPDDLSRINLAFFTTNGFASILFAAFAILSFYIG